MGFDVTFHPVAEHELRHFVFDVLDDPSLAYPRAQELTCESIKQQVVIDVYRHFPKWRADWKKDPRAIPRTLAFAAAAIAGHLHPYWYSRGGSISFVAMNTTGFPHGFRSWDQLSPTLDALGMRGDTLIVENYSASGFIPPAQLPALRAALDEVRHRSAVDHHLGAAGRAALGHAIDYALAHGLGILEASDIVVPISGDHVSDPDNFRAPHLHNEADARTARLAAFTSLDEALANPWMVGELDLSDQGLTSLPDGMEKLVRLRNLELRKNAFTVVPEVVSSFASLYALHLGNNRLSALPPWIGTFSKLEHLNLQINELTHLPDAIGNLEKLSALYMFRNRLVDLPASIGRLGALSLLDLTNNELTSLPATVADLAPGLTIFLGGNAFKKAEKDRIKGLLPGARTVMFTVPSRYAREE
jgi:hypothetical protein